MTIKRIKIQNLLSFGPKGIDLELKPLNVLIGPNGCGKSNLLAAISLFQAAPTDIGKPIRESDGIKNWLWRRTNNLTIEIYLEGYNPIIKEPFTHSISIKDFYGKVGVTDEKITLSDKICVYIDSLNYAMYEVTDDVGVPYKIERETNSSVLAYLKDKSKYAGLYSIGEQYKNIRIYNTLNDDQSLILRKPQETDFFTTILNEDLSNLFICLNEIKLNPQSKKLLLENLAHVAEGITDFEIRYEFNSAILFLEEREFNYPASRLSDGTLKYLCLLAIVLHPNPPNLICIEEPENGLHPDLIIEVARLIKEASNKTQIIVTTHSPLFLDCMEPEDVIVCEKHNGETTMDRLNGEHLTEWLKDYTLGHVWSSGQIGGNRW